MPTPAENLQTSYENLCAKLAEVTADPKPSYSVDGESYSWGEYYEMLSRQIEAVKKQINRVKPYYKRSRHRG